MTKTRPKTCRIASVSGWQCVLVGMDFAQVFKPGYVYSAVRVLHEIVITEIGEHAQAENHHYRKITNHLVEGVVLLTKEEYEARPKEGK